jgi:hypothetical protein
MQYVSTLQGRVLRITSTSTGSTDVAKNSKLKLYAVEGDRTSRVLCLWRDIKKTERRCEL